MNSYRFSQTIFLTSSRIARKRFCLLAAADCFLRLARLKKVGRFCFHKNADLIKLQLILCIHENTFSACAKLFAPFFYGLTVQSYKPYFDLQYYFFVLFLKPYTFFLS